MTVLKFDKLYAAGVPKFNALYASLPSNYYCKETETKLFELYLRELESIQSAMDRVKTPRVDFSLFRDTGGYQIIADCYVNDLSAPAGNSYNWHLVNTSQVVYAFGIVFDKQRLEFSSHH